jgi:hypothetical protein
MRLKVSTEEIKYVLYETELTLINTTFYSWLKNESKK